MLLWTCQYSGTLQWLKYLQEAHWATEKPLVRSQPRQKKNNHPDASRDKAVQHGMNLSTQSQELARS